MNKIKEILETLENQLKESCEQLQQALPDLELCEVVWHNIQDKSIHIYKGIEKLGEVTFEDFPVEPYPYKAYIIIDGIKFYQLFTEKEKQEYENK